MSMVERVSRVESALAPLKARHWVREARFIVQAAKPSVGGASCLDRLAIAKLERLYA